MNAFIKQLVNQKMNRMTPMELKNLGEKYGTKISHTEAEEVMKIIRSMNFDIFNEQDRRSVLNNIANSTNPDLAKNLEALFNRFLRWAGKKSR